MNIQEKHPTPSHKLWTPIGVGRMTLQHRLVMSPMTRSRSHADGTPGDLGTEYYTQRASLGLLISEAVQPSDDGQGYMNTPGIYRPEHIVGWQGIIDAVHSHGAHFGIQLMHVGRMSHPDNTPHHRLPLGPSAIASGMDMYTPTGPKPAPVPREMTEADIEQTIEDFRWAASRAMEAGADAVEIHGANGYLLHQFLSPNANLREDGYGGTVEGRSRLAMEVVRAVADEIGADRVGLRLSPGLVIGGIEEGDGVREQYRHLVGELAGHDLAYLSVTHAGDEELIRELRSIWPGILFVLRPGAAPDALGRDIDDDLADVVPVARLALANPDLVRRLAEGHPLNESDPSTYYGGAAAGYTDYPAL